MRKFGTDSPAFMSFTIGDSKKVYKFPLAASMPLSTLLELEDAVAKGGTDVLVYQMELLRRYIGDKVDDLSAGDVAKIYAAWNEESREQGITPGE